MVGYQMVKKNSSGPEKRLAILRAAAGRMAKPNVRQASVRQIAAGADVSTGLVQHYFPTKRALRDAVDKAVLDSLGQHVAVIGRTLQPEDAGRALGQCLADFMTSEPEFAAYVRSAILEP